MGEVRGAGNVIVTLFSDLTFPCTIDALKDSFRRASKRCHPDAGGSHDQFIHLKREYDRLLRDPSTFTIARTHARTVDGADLSDLGLGLGPTTNGKDCPECKRVGYRTYTNWRERPCPQRRRIGWSTLCYCHSDGMIRERSGDYHTRCARCDGTGEIAVFNPVILKGALR